MWNKIIGWVMAVFWPLIRDEVLPIVWEFLKKHSDQILMWLWERIKEIFEKDTEKELLHAQEQEKKAEAMSLNAQNAQVAEAWKEAADYWRAEYERVNARLQRNIEELTKATFTAHEKMYSVIDKASPNIDFRADEIELIIGDEKFQIEPPK